MGPLQPLTALLSNQENEPMKRFWTLLPHAALLLAVATAFAHEGHDDRDPKSKVTIKSEGDKRVIDANGLPDHKPGQFPNRGNPNEISAQKYHFEMPLKPKAAEEQRPLRGYLFGVAVNGVVFDPGTAEIWQPGDKIVSRPGPGTRMGPGVDRSKVWNYQGMGRMNLGIDGNHAHVQPTGAYHYHGLPTGLIDRLRKEQGTDKMLLIGYAADGFPFYAEYGHEKADDAKSPLKKLTSSYHMKKGNRPKGDDGPGSKYDGTFEQDFEFVEGSGDLDKSNGRTGVTPEYPEGTYYYVATADYPFIPRFFHGTPDNSFAKRMGPPPGGPGGPDGPPGRRGRRGSPPSDGPPPRE
jgi:hypothetical protein